MNGGVNLLKPPGISSSGAVVFVRGLLKEKRVGHAGTLDPGAAGVLPVCVGRSTRLSDYLMSNPKTYLAEILFGVETDTLDTYGTVTRREDCLVSRQALQQVLPSFLGEIWQTPPAYSAVSIDGKRSYELARKGIETHKPKRKITVYSLRYCGSTGKNRHLVEVCCSKGTYIRTLAKDIGEVLGVPACLSFLLRTRSGGMEIEKAYTIDELKEMVSREDYSFLVPAEQLTMGLPSYRIPAREGAALKNGQRPSAADAPEGIFRVYSDQEFLGIGEKYKEDTLRLTIPLWND